MPSNALSQKSFGTKTPAVCHPPPWPPTIPIPPLNTSRFFCFATLRYDHAIWPARFAASAVLRPNPPWPNFYGISSPDPTIPWFKASLWPYPTFPKYRIRVEWHWDKPYPLAYIWLNKQFCPNRPYAGEDLTYKQPSPVIRMYVVVRETPP